MKNKTTTDRQVSVKPRPDFFKSEEHRFINLNDREPLEEFWLKEHIRNLNDKGTVMDGTSLYHYKEIASFSREPIVQVNESIAQAAMEGKASAEVNISAPASVIDAIAHLLSCSDLPTLVETKPTGVYWLSVFIGHLIPKRASNQTTMENEHAIK